MAIYEVAL